MSKRLLGSLLGFLALAHAIADSDVVYKKFHVDSLIVSRFAVTTVTSVIRNNAAESKGLDFQVQLPEGAFVSSFTMLVNDKTFHGIAKEKEAAAVEFQDRQEAGQNVGLVESRGTEVFSVRTNTAGNSEATFVLQYEELIVRRRSKYQQVLTLNPGAVVEDLSVQVRAVDLQGVVSETASQFATTERLSESEVLFSYRPSAEQQREDSEQFGLARDLTVEYDVVHPPDGAGQFVLDSNCYFAQFFSPSGVEAVPVDLVFVIDVSGSMRGSKIEQTRQALETIINQLRPADRFTMITFSGAVHHWKERLVSASEYRQQGIDFAQGLQAEGGTNFNDGLLAGATVLKSHGRSDYVPLLVILTDGQPTAGVTNENTIVVNAANALAGTTISLNCLGFGFDLNFKLLERLAYQNNGVVRRIYEGSDATDQLQGFFEEISSPILKDIAITYHAPFELITDTHFPILYNGSEIVVAGKFNCSSIDADTVLVIVNGSGVMQEVVFQSKVNVQENITLGSISPNIERLTAYLIIKQLLAKLSLTDFPEEASAIKQQALALALKYNFATDLTSLIVVEEGAEEGEGRQLGGPPRHDDIPGAESSYTPTSYPTRLPGVPGLPVFSGGPPAYYPPPATAHPGIAPPATVQPSTAPPATVQPSTAPPATVQPSTAPATPSILTTCPQAPQAGSLYINLVRGSPVIAPGPLMTVHFETPDNTRANCTLRKGRRELVKVDCSNGSFQHSVTWRLFGNYTLQIEVEDANGNELEKYVSLPDYHARQNFCYGHAINEATCSGGDMVIPFRMYGPYTRLDCRLTGAGGQLEQRYTPCVSPVVARVAPGSHVLTVKSNGCGKKRNLKILFQK